MIRDVTKGDTIKMKLLASFFTAHRPATLALGAIGLCAAPAISQQSPPEISEGDELVFSSTLTAGDTTGGGAWVNEKDVHWKRGIITAIEVCAGAYVNSITPYYNGMRGTTFGGAGGDCERWPVPADQYIQAVEVWSGAWMNKITFRTNKLQEKTFGGAGGNRKVWEDPEGGSLRKIDGKYGDFINGLKLGFTYPYYIENFQYPLLSDTSKFEEFIKPRPPERVDYQVVSACRDNPGSFAQQTVTVSVNEKETHSFSFGGSATIGLETEVMAGVPDIASATARTKAEFSVSFEETNAIEKDYGYQVELQGRAEGGQKKAIVTTMKKADVSVPFTYDLIHYKQGRKNRIVSKQPYSGVYTGVRVAAVDTEQIAIDCDTDQPVIETPQGSTQTASTPPATNTPTEVTPYTVTTVTTSSGAVFQSNDDGYWNELSETGDARFTFEVLDRDDDCVFLIDVNRGVMIILNLTRNKVEYAPNADAEPFDLYDIVGKS
ncbi:MAG: jacalin-like lectin [Henriciella sp.]